MADEHKEIDALTGTATTGHDWDGIRELNTPLPRWWLWTFYITILWAVGYWIVYPAWPLLTTSTQGLFGYHTRSAVLEDLAELKAMRGPMMDKLTNASIAEISRDPQLLEFARAQGRVAFADNCAPCHGAGGGGTKGYPNLNDDDWLWGGKLAEIEQTIRHGARSGDDKGRVGNMPAFGRDGILKANEISVVADFVRSLSGLPTEKGADLALGKKVFADNCALCHGPEGKGNRDMGAPNLTDKIWFYGSDKETIMQGLRNGRGGVMPAWQGRLSEPTIKALTLYVYSFGGGEIIVQAVRTLSLDQASSGAPALARLIAEAEVSLPPDDDGPLYAAPKQISPQSVHGRFRRIKWAVLLVTLGIYYLLPFVRWDRGPNAPAQAVLIDFPSRRFYFFFIEIWPQEVYYLTGLLILAAIALFLMNAVAGRVWCGYLCPQTVWTDLFFAIERFFEGDRREHMRRDGQKWTAETYARKGAKHFFWLIVAWWTGGAWVLYFADAPTLVWELATGTAPFAAYLWIGILTATTYTFAGHMREQVCLYMCPWPRIQAALTDEYALNVTYRYDRGEPRCSAKKAEQLHAQGMPAGDCVDCLQCVHVCPTGVDIRGGASLGCIQCGLCIDACDNIMVKLGRATGLIAYDTDLNIKQRIEGKQTFVKLVRMRTMLYAAVIAIAGGIMIYTLATRDSEGISVIHDRNPMFVRLSDGALRNGYTIRIVNKRLKYREFIVGVDGLPSTLIDFVGLPPRADGRQLISVGPDQTREVRVVVTDYSAAPPAPSTTILFKLIDADSGEVAEMRDHFFGP